MSVESLLEDSVADAGEFPVGPPTVDPGVTVTVEATGAAVVRMSFMVSRIMMPMMGCLATRVEQTSSFKSESGVYAGLLFIFY